MNSSMQRRRGAVMLVTLVVLAVIGAILAGTVGASLRGKREQKRNAYARQAQLMLDAGIARAVNSLEMDPSYQGEQWDLAPAFPEVQIATVDISVEREQPAMPTQVTVRARLQPGISEDHATQATFAFVLPAKT